MSSEIRPGGSESRMGKGQAIYLNAVQSCSVGFVRSSSLPAYTCKTFNNWVCYRFLPYVVLEVQYYRMDTLSLNIFLCCFCECVYTEASFLNLQPTYSPRKLFCAVFHLSGAENNVMGHFTLALSLTTWASNGPYHFRKSNLNHVKHEHC